MGVGAELVKVRTSLTVQVTLFTFQNMCKLTCSFDL